MIGFLRSNKANDYRYPLPIFVFLTGLLLWVGVAAVTAQQAIRAVLPASTLVVLLSLQLALHWYSPRLAGRERSWLGYTLAQAFIATGLTLVSSDQSVWVVVFGWLIGETAGLVAKPWLAAVSLAVYGITAVAALFAVSSVAVALSWLGAFLPTTLFVCVVVVLYRRQVEAREHAQRLIVALETANDQIAAYAGRVAELTLVNERQRMARELHDTLAQDIAGLVLQLEAAKAHLDADRTERAGSIVAQALLRARTTLRDARNAIDDLRARDARSSLSHGLEQLCERWRIEAEIACELTVDAGMWDAALPADAREQLERIVLEALANVRRHARARRAQVLVSADHAYLSLRVTDDGIGFRPEAVPAVGHYGISGIIERAALLGGSAEISSAPGRGTTLMVRLPLARYTAPILASQPAATERSAG